MTKRVMIACLVLSAACSHATQQTTPAISSSASPAASAAVSPVPAVRTSAPGRTPAISSEARSTPASTPASATPRIAVVVMENKEYARIAGSPDAPYLNGLARKYASATSYYAVSHPSLPNYLALIGGDTFGIASDCTSCHVHAPNLAVQLQDKHVSWKAYMEGMPLPCFTGPSAGRYAKKHNPFVYFDDVVSSPAVCANVVPLNTIDYNALPDFVWVTPDLCNDTHDCSIATGDRYLSNLVPKLLRGLGPRGVVVITYDEGSTGAHGGGHVFTVLAGPGVRPGRYAETFDHYSLLRTIEETFALPPLAKASSAPSMSALLR
jgi:hypothetical protein